jgi:hypothetical protein
VPRGSASVHSAGDGDAGLAEDMGNLGIAQAGSVVFEREQIFLLVDVEFAQAVGIGEFAETAELIEAQRCLQLVGDFEECHEGNYTSTASFEPAQPAARSSDRYSHPVRRPVPRA